MKFRIFIYYQVIAMIETRQAIENVEAILDVEGLDGAFIGNKICYFVILGLV